MGRKGIWAGFLTVWTLLLPVAVQAAAGDDLLAAQEAYRRGNEAALIRQVEALQGHLLEPVARYWLLSRTLTKAEPDAIEAYLQEAADSHLSDRLRADWLRELARREDWDRYRNEYPRLIDVTSEHRCYRWQAALAKGEALGREARALWFAGKDLPASCDPVFQHLASTGQLTEADTWARLRLALEQNSQGLARHLIRQLGFEVEAKTVSEMSEQPRKWADQAFSEDRVTRELQYFALFRLARSDVDAALAAWEARRANVSAAEQAYVWRLLAYAGALKHDPRASVWYRLSESYEWRDDQRAWQARLALRAGDWSTVQRAIQQMSAGGRAERAWQYWQARAYQELRRSPTEASRLLAQLSVEDDYYGLLARERLGPVLASQEQSYRVNEADLERAQRNTALLRALRLYEFGLRTEAAREFSWSLRGADDRMLLAAAELASQAGWYDRAIYAADRTKSLHDRNLRYLSPYREVTKGYAEELGLDEAWVFGLIRQESRFVTGARSSVGAGGLMQLMPGTAQWVANRLKIRYHAGVVNEVGTNVRLGTYYLRHILDKLGGNPVLATAGYNAGPNRARDWQLPDSTLEAAIYVESIPFGETRDYVKKVMANAVNYAQVFGQSPQALSQRMGVVAARNPVVIEGP